nr:MAG: hypothetical protein DIU66_09055 [Bacillota bacterium]
MQKPLEIDDNREKCTRAGFICKRRIFYFLVEIFIENYKELFSLSSFCFYDFLRVFSLTIRD